MRGFLVHFRPPEGAESGASARSLAAALADWKRGLPPGALREIGLGRFACALFSQIPTPPEYNQVWTPSADGRSGCLRVGPRASLPGEGTIAFPPPGGPADWARHRSLFDGGMETCVLIASDGASLSVKTDLLNSTFVYAWERDGHLLLSSSSLLLARLTGAALDKTAAAEFLSVGSIFGNRSLYTGIVTLPPARFLRWAGPGRPQAEAYWEPHALAFGSLGLAEATRRVVGALDADFQRLKRAADGRFVLDLTGGYDSRCNFGFALRNRLAFRTTVTGNAGEEDAEIAQSLATHYGISHSRAEYWSGTEREAEELLQRSQGFTDLEYDVCEYAHILQVHERGFRPDDISMHGSTADVMRNYFLLPGFYQPDPEGRLDLDALIGRKFAPGVPAGSFAAGVLPDWTAHMRERIGAYDQPGLPAYARLDNIYLRVRMQFWQGRIASSTNRLHASFTPWTNADALEAILCARWQEKAQNRLSRALLGTLVPGLDRFPLAGGANPRPGNWPGVSAYLHKGRYYAGRIAARLGSAQAARPFPGGGAKAARKLEAFAGRFEGWLSGQALDRLRSGPPGPALAQRLLTVAMALAALESPAPSGAASRAG